MLTLTRSVKRLSHHAQAEKVLFFGTDDFAATHLDRLVHERENGNRRVGAIEVVCPPDRYTGRKLQQVLEMPVKKLATKYRLPVHHTPAQGHSLRDWKMPTNEDQLFDLGIVVSFGYFLPSNILRSFRKGIINVHPSLLPKYRGAAPIQHSIIDGADEFGVSIQELDSKEFDAGRILAQVIADVSSLPEKRFSLVSKRLAEVGADLLIDTVNNFEERREHAWQQDAQKATKAPKITKEKGRVHFDVMNSSDIYRLWLGISEQFPLHTEFTPHAGNPKKLMVQLHGLHSVESHSSKLTLPGSIEYDTTSSNLVIKCAQDTFVRCDRLKVENKGLVKARDFMNGYGLKDGDLPFM